MPTLTPTQLQELKDLFIKFLTGDSETQDARKKDFNQAIFNLETGRQCWNDTSLDMVLDKFDKATKYFLNNQND